jgi:hypothetical protein
VATPHRLRHHAGAALSAIKLTQNHQLGLEEASARLHKRGAQLVGEVVQYEDSYRLCYIRGPEGLLIGLAEQLGKNQ